MSFKKGSPTAGNLKDRYTDEFFDHHNRNGIRDLSALRFLERLDEVDKSALALPDVLRLHHVCCTDYLAAIAKCGATIQMMTPATPITARPPHEFKQTRQKNANGPQLPLRAFFIF